MFSLVNSYKNATRIGWHLCQIELRFAPGLPPGWNRDRARVQGRGLRVQGSGLRVEGLKSGHKLFRLA
jgi:hypothetical protein